MTSITPGSGRGAFVDHHAAAKCPHGALNRMSFRDAPSQACVERRQLVEQTSTPVAFEVVFHEPRRAPDDVSPQPRVRSSGTVKTAPRRPRRAGAPRLCPSGRRRPRCSRMRRPEWTLTCHRNRPAGPPGEDPRDPLDADPGDRAQLGDTPHLDGQPRGLESLSTAARAAVRGRRLRVCSSKLRHRRGYTGSRRPPAERVTRPKGSPTDLPSHGIRRYKGIANPRGPDGSGRFAIVDAMSRRPGARDVPGIRAAA
jgi:hypothetical protein